MLLNSINQISGVIAVDSDFKKMQPPLFWLMRLFQPK